MRNQGVMLEVWSLPERGSQDTRCQRRAASEEKGGARYLRATAGVGHV